MTKKNSLPRKPLQLTTETMRTLDAADLEGVAGGQRMAGSYVYTKCGSACTSANSCSLSPCC